MLLNTSPAPSQASLPIALHCASVGSFIFVCINTKCTHYTVLHYTTLRYATLHYTTLHYNTTLHWIALLHYTVGTQRLGNVSLTIKFGNIRIAYSAVASVLMHVGQQMSHRIQFDGVSCAATKTS